MVQITVVAPYREFDCRMGEENFANGKKNILYAMCNK